MGSILFMGESRCYVETLLNSTWNFITAIKTPKNLTLCSFHIKTVNCFQVQREEVNVNDVTTSTTHCRT